MQNFVWAGIWLYLKRKPKYTMIPCTANSSKACSRFLFTFFLICHCSFLRVTRHSCIWLLWLIVIILWWYRALTWLYKTFYSLLGEHACPFGVSSMKNIQQLVAWGASCSLAWCSYCFKVIRVLAGASPAFTLSYTFLIKDQPVGLQDWKWSESASTEGYHCWAVGSPPHPRQLFGGDFHWRSMACTANEAASGQPYIWTAVGSKYVF